MGWMSSAVAPSLAAKRLRGPWLKSPVTANQLNDPGLPTGFVEKVRLFSRGSGNPVPSRMPRGQIWVPIGDA